MPIIRKGQNIHITTPANPIEKHFHDHDETWVVLKGEARCFSVDRDGNRDEFILKEGDIWMIEVGTEHGATPITPEFKLIYIYGTAPEGAKGPGHYYMEDEGYIPGYKLIKKKTDRYSD